MNISQKKKLIILAVLAFGVTLIALLIIKPSKEEATDSPVISAETSKYQVTDCKGELISDDGAAQGRAIAYVDSPESGTDAKIITPPAGKNTLAVSCDVMNLSSAPVDFLDYASAEVLVSGKKVEATVYAENQSHLDSNGYPTRSTYGATIYKGESTKMWYIAFVDNTVATGDDSLVINYSLRGNEHSFNIRDNLTIY